MCDQAKSYLGVIREYSKEIVMLLGFGLAACIYSDFRALTYEVVQQQTQTAEILRSLDTRISNLERDHAKWSAQN